MNAAEEALRVLQAQVVRSVSKRTRLTGPLTKAEKRAIRQAVEILRRDK